MEKQQKKIKNSGYRTMQYLVLPYNRKHNVYYSVFPIMFPYVQTMHLFVRMVTSRFTCLIQTNSGM